MDVDPQGSKTMTESAPTTPASNLTPQPNDFSQQAGEPQPSLIAEFLDFLVNNKAWWLTPIIVVLSLVGLLVVAGSSVAAPFIYALF
ncbi:MAG: hypothetical protein JWN70_1372 [Planctomycetaceae bacterium]|nr:hypothetical protein [Planctomycetaceae bacterium]